MVTHDGSVATRADRIVEMLDGRLALHPDHASATTIRGSLEPR
jgi:ABC-type lipoprotein export system ATPase subunit